MPDNRPTSRKKTVSSGSSSVKRRGSGLGTGPVGTGHSTHNNSHGGGSFANGSHSYGSNGHTGMSRAAIGGSGGGLLIIIAIVLFTIFGKGGNSLPGGTSLLQSGDNTGSQTSMSAVNTSVAEGSRNKRTVIKGNGKDTVTIMVYMCGTDLESKGGMATNDLTEMSNATIGKNVNLIVYTGGCTKWKNNVISNKTNQIYQVKDGGLKCLVKDDGDKAMTSPSTLSSFIEYCTKNFPANRNDLILWDHGGGSVSGYGYDEKNSSKGSMTLSGIKNALKAGGTTFDFIGFDACLMATAETAIMLDDYADYLIASEETEPGIGWYYTNWLSKLSKDTSMSTLEIGKNIIDDFNNACAKSCNGQKTTLSIVDLAEFANTVPDKLKNFSLSVSDLIKDENYKKVSDARYETREFAANTRIDQVDLADLAQNVGTDEGLALKTAIMNAVKYNRTSANITDAYGISIYFPYRRTNYVDKAVDTYDEIGLDDEYSNCIKQFASLETTGQVSAGGTSSPLGSLLGSGSSSGSGSADVIGSLFETFLGGGGDISIDGLTGIASGFLSDRALDTDYMSDYVSDNYFDESALVWDKEKDGSYILSLSEKQWSLVHELDKNVFYDDGNGYVDLGLDNVFSFNNDGDLIADTDKDWLSIDGQIVPYYHTDTTVIDGEETITGFVPCMLNDSRAELIIVFDESNKDGYISGAKYTYKQNETLTVAKEMTKLNEGDTIDFICDYYTYDGTYEDSYFLGDQMTYHENMTISNIAIDEGDVVITYLFTDIYNNKYWSESINK